MTTALVAATAPGPVSIDPRAEACVERFADAWTDVETITYSMAKRERLRSGRTIVEEIAIKLQKPQTLYVAQIKPRRGQEAIYDPERDREELVAHPGRFPDFTVSLNVLGRHATKDQHHPVSHIGFAYTLDVVRRLIENARASPHGERFIFLGVEQLNGQPVEHVRFEGGGAPWRLAKARDDESVFELADRIRTDPYLVYYHNEQIEAFTDELEEGTTYRVPPYYAKTLDLWFSVENRMLVRMEARDFEGRLYELFDFIDMRLNPRLTKRDFDPDNPDYDF